MLFKRLLDFQREALARLRDKRKSARYPVASEFPVRPLVSLVGSDSPKAVAGPGINWAGKLVDVSNHGARVLLPPAALTRRGEKTMLTLVVDDMRFEVPCEVVHFRTNGQAATCGLALRPVTDPVVETAFAQLVEAVATGATLKPNRATGLVRAPAGMVREQFRSHNGATLTAWRAKKGGILDSFEFCHGEHCIRGEVANPELEIYTHSKAVNPARVAWSDHSFAFSSGAHPDARRLFRLVALNLSREVPSDLRKLVQRFARG